MNRQFFALVPDAETRARVSGATNALQTECAIEGRLLNPARYHMTLKFLGNTVTTLAETAFMNAATKIEAPPFNLRLDRVGSFENDDISIWLGSSDIPAELVFLDMALRRAIGQHPRQHKISFVPHLTIMREAKATLATLPIPAIEWQVREFVLIRSVLKPKAYYEILRSYPLTAAGIPPEPEQQSLF